MKISNYFSQIISSLLFTSRLRKDFTIYSFGRILAAVISISILPLFTRYLPKHDFGIIGLLWLFIPLVSRLINLGVDVSLSLKMFKLNQQAFANYLYNSVSVITFSGIFLYCLGLQQLAWINQVLNSAMDVTLYSIFFMGIMGLVYTTILQSIFQLSGQSVLNVIYTVAPPAIVALTTYYIVLTINQTYAAYLISLAISYGIFGIISIIYLFRKYSIKHFKLSLQVIGKLLAVGLPVLPGTVAAIILSSGDRYIIKAVAGLEAVAVYTLGYRIAEYVLITICQPFQKAFYPIILETAANDFEMASRFNSDVINTNISYISMLIAVVVLPFNLIILWLGGGDYSDAYLICLISLVGIMFFHVGQLINNLLMHLERTAINMLIVSVCAGINILLNIWLIPLYGIIAAAATTVISYLIMMALTVLVLNNYLSMKVSLVSLLLRCLPICCYLVVIFQINSRWGNLPPLVLYPLQLFAMVAYILILIALFPDIRETLRKLLLVFLGIGGTRRPI